MDGSRTRSMRWNHWRLRKDLQHHLRPRFMAVSTYLPPRELRSRTFKDRQIACFPLTPPLQTSISILGPTSQLGRTSLSGAITQQAVIPATGILNRKSHLHRPNRSHPQPTFALHLRPVDQIPQSSASLRLSQGKDPIHPILMRVHEPRIERTSEMEPRYKPLHRRQFRNRMPLRHYFS